MISDYLRNKLGDALLRGQAYTFPATIYIGLASTAAPAGVTEVTGGGLARFAVTSSLVNWSGTQAEGSTGVSTGTSGLFSNNNEISIAAALTAAKTAAYVVLFDAEVGGNFLLANEMTDTDGNALSRSWNIGDPVVIAAGDLEITLS